jgi:hypothetical protein
VGLNVTVTAEPVEGVSEIPVIPTVAEMMETLVSETGVDVIVKANCAVVPPPPPPPPPLVSGTPLQAESAMM